MIDTYICIYIYIYIYIITCEGFGSSWLLLLVVQFLVRPVSYTHSHALQNVSNDIPYNVVYCPSYTTM